MPIECNCGIQMKVDIRIIEKNEVFMCPNCYKISFVNRHKKYNVRPAYASHRDGASKHKG